MPIYSVPTWLEIDLGAIRHNTRRMAEVCATPVMAVVKANAYGHGLVQVARAALDGGATWLGMARLEEALGLREAGIQANLLVLSMTLPERAAEAAAAGVRLTVFDPQTAAQTAACARAAGQTLRVHAKFDTGMGRLGVPAEDGVEFVRYLQSLTGLEVEGVFTHLAEADDPPRPSTLLALDRFDLLLEGLNGAGLRPSLVHAANSAAALYFPRARYDLVRPGIAVYGLHPSADAPLPDDFRPALSWKAHLASVKVLPPGHGIGYNFRYTTSRHERIGVCPAGYADGFRRRLGNYVLVGGKRVAVVGGVCMDQCMLQLDEIPEARIGDEIVLIGQQGNEQIRAEELGQAWGTVNYDVVCGLNARVPRYYQE
jgi:alanine racemase